MRPILAVAFLTLLMMWVYTPKRTSAGVRVSGEPYQAMLYGSQPFKVKGYRFTPIADFNLEARVLGKEVYHWDRTAELAPVDLAVGWGPMSDQSVLDGLIISQGNRWYTWRPKQNPPPLPLPEIISHSANMHMIPSSSAVERTLGRVRTGDVVSLRGQLVWVQGNDGFDWRSSLSRTDTGNGACEIVWVRELTIR